MRLCRCYDRFSLGWVVENGVSVSPELSFAKKGVYVGTITGVISLLALYLTLASDNKWWPFGAGVWVPTVVAAMLVTSAVIVLVRLFKGSSSNSISTSAVRAQIVGLMLVPALATGLLVAVWVSNAPAQVEPTTLPKVAIDSPGDGSVHGGAVEVSGRIDVPLRPGQAIFVAVGEKTVTGSGEPDLYYLQPGPCEVLREGREWKCRHVGFGGKANSEWQIVAFGAEGSRLLNIVDRLHSGPAFEAEKAANPAARDRRNLDVLPADVMEFDRVSTKIGTGK